MGEGGKGEREGQPCSVTSRTITGTQPLPTRRRQTCSPNTLHTHLCLRVPPRVCKHREQAFQAPQKLPRGQGDSSPHRPTTAPACASGQKRDAKVVKGSWAAEHSQQLSDLCTNKGLCHIYPQFAMMVGVFIDSTSAGGVNNCSVHSPFQKKSDLHAKDKKFKRLPM